VTQQTKRPRTPKAKTTNRASNDAAGMGDAQYRQMFEKNRAIQMLVAPSDGSILDANLAAANFYGYTIEQLKALKMTDINTMPPEAVDKAMATVIDKQAYSYNCRHALASGEVRDVEVHVSPVEVNGKQILYSIVHDITERRRAEEEVARLNADLERRVAERTVKLKAANLTLEREVAERKVLEEQVRSHSEALQSEYERLATIIASVDVSLSVLNPDSTIVLVNDAWLERTGLQREQVIGVRYGNIARQPGAAQIQQWIDQVVETGLPFNERELPIPDERYPGGALYVDATILPIRDDEGNLTGLLTVSIDVTEKVLARRGVEAQRALLESIIENSPIAIAFYDRDLRVVSANSAWERISGLNRLKAIGQILYDVSESARARRPHFERALKGEIVKRENVAGRGPEGEIRYYDITYLPVKAVDGVVEGILAIGVDMTEREQLDQQKDQFIALASHELKSPITVIRGYARLTAKSVEQLGDRQLGRRIQTIEEQAQRLTRMVDDLLDVSRMQGGALILDQRPFDLRDAVSEVVKNTQPAAPGFTFDVRVSSSPLTVNGDRTRIEQVLANLLQNAVKYSGESRQVEIALEKEHDRAVTSVRDHGMGVPAGQQSQIFDRFFRASNVRDGHSGFGLGLFIAHNIVTAHGGHIWLESVEGQGSTFRFALPVA
jgi:PAS domain S-box-containing protein